MSGKISINSVVDAVDQMIKEGIVDRYAIGGAFAATLHNEPIATVDLDIFFLLKKPQDGVILSLDEIYDFAKKHGFGFDHEFVKIDEWLVQFVESSHSALWREAIETSQILNADGLDIPVIDPEHLVAMWLFAGRAKDYQKIALFLEADIVDKQRLDSVLEKHQLMLKWQKERRRFGD